MLGCCKGAAGGGQRGKWEIWREGVKEVLKGGKGVYNGRV